MHFAAIAFWRRCKGWESEEITFMRENGEQRSAGVEIDLQELLMFYLRKWWMIILCAVLAGAIALGGTYFLMTPLYKASVSVYVNNNRESPEDGYVSYNDLSVSLRLVNTYINIITSDRVMDKVSAALNNEYTSNQLAGYLSAEQVENTEIFRLYVTHPDPEEAARIANVVAQIAPDEISKIIEGSSARVIDLAKVPTQKASPNYSTLTILGIVAGALVAIVFLTVRKLSDTRIKNEDDLAALFDMPILGRIPDLTQSGDADAYIHAYAKTSGRRAK